MTSPETSLNQNSPNQSSIGQSSQTQEGLSNVLVATGVLDRTVATTELRLPDGRIVRLPTSLLESGSTAAPEQGRAAAAFSKETVSAAAGGEVAASGQVSAGSGVVPIVEETLRVGKRTVATGTVRLHKSVQEFETALNEPLAVRTFDVERVVLNQTVEAAPAVRYEGDTTIYPLVEEQLILTKHLVLKEEIRVTKRDTERHDTRTVTLRREHLEIEREPR